MSCHFVRFGLASSSADEDAKKKARLERFGQSTNVDKGEEEKRKARALRYECGSAISFLLIES